MKAIRKTNEYYLRANMMGQYKALISIRDWFGAKIIALKLHKRLGDDIDWSPRDDEPTQKL